MDRYMRIGSTGSSKHNIICNNNVLTDNNIYDSRILNPIVSDNVITGNNFGTDFILSGASVATTLSKNVIVGNRGHSLIAARGTSVSNGDNLVTDNNANVGTINEWLPSDLLVSSLTPVPYPIPNGVNN